MGNVPSVPGFRQSNATHGVACRKRLIDYKRCVRVCCTPLILADASTRTGPRRSAAGSKWSRRRASGMPPAFCGCDVKAAAANVCAPGFPKIQNYSLWGPAAVLRGDRSVPNTRECGTRYASSVAVGNVALGARSYTSVSRGFKTLLDRYFYLCMALLMAGLAVWGFS